MVEQNEKLLAKHNRNTPAKGGRMAKVGGFARAGLKHAGKGAAILAVAGASFTFHAVEQTAFRFSGANQQAAYMQREAVIQQGGNPYGPFVAMLLGKFADRGVTTRTPAMALQQYASQQRQSVEQPQQVASRGDQDSGNFKTVTKMGQRGSEKVGESEMDVGNTLRPDQKETMMEGMFAAFVPEHLAEDSSKKQPQPQATTVSTQTAARNKKAMADRMGRG